MLDLRDMHALDIDADSHTAWVQTGLTAGDLLVRRDANVAS